jgi:hydrogenase/urease accessory protein HupE
MNMRMRLSGILAQMAGWKGGLSSALVGLVLGLGSAAAHEVMPSIADMTQAGDRLEFAVQANLESFIAGIDLTVLSDTSEAPQASDYDALHQLGAAALEARFRAFWPEMAARIFVLADGRRLEPELVGVTIPDPDAPDLARRSGLQFSVTLPEGAQAVTVAWDGAFGALVLRQQGVDAPYDGYLEGGAVSDPIRLSGGGQAGQWETFFNYIPVGFDHIVPKGLDHILFVLGLFLLSTRASPLLWQVTAFTLAHTVTLALSALGYVSIPTAIVEPLIAASIVYVAIENTLTTGLSRWRPMVVFGFGLLHGLGFASVLGEFGLPDNAFVPALIGFNIGVELGQLAVIAIAAALLWTWAARQPWYRRMVSIPASLAIAAVGAFWVVQRMVM